jgi:hypothetical protein
MQISSGTGSNPLHLGLEKKLTKTELSAFSAISAVNEQLFPFHLLFGVA